MFCWFLMRLYSITFFVAAMNLSVNLYPRNIYQLKVSNRNNRKRSERWLYDYHVAYVFLSESTLYSCLNVRELFARSRCDIWSLSDSNGIRSHNHLVRRRTLDHLAKLAKWLCCVVSTQLYGAFDCMLLSCHVRGLEWIYTL